MQRPWGTASHQVTRGPRSWGPVRPGSGAEPGGHLGMWPVRQPGGSHRHLSLGLRFCHLHSQDQAALPVGGGAVLVSKAPAHTVPTHGSIPGMAGGGQEWPGPHLCSGLLSRGATGPLQRRPYSWHLWLHLSSGCPPCAWSHLQAGEAPSSTQIPTAAPVWAQPQGSALQNTGQKLRQ